MLKKFPINNIKYVISFLFILVFLLPYGQVYTMKGRKSLDESWEYVFIWEDSLATIGMALYTISWIIYNLYPQLLTSIVLVFCSVVIFLGISFSGFQQDFQPGFGMLLTLIVTILIWIRSAVSTKLR